ncbi:hypothetical protein B0T18DRAFT_332669 [Schizothecium vesticola]|uniref:RBR-type E3 ubiquitin transferase n=1 Tax=Schizothecium vesticola TaxID=314040 RepID=A0AA40EJI5_9PEZI|nr:hypothetical protein B0T18DRAFT_332669 [Schizothecium vesticola]
MDMSSLDHETLRLIIQAWLEDIQELSQSNDPKGKGREGGPEANLNVLLETYREELAAAEQLLKDQSMCKSMSLAAIRDGEAIQAAMAVDDQIARDHQLAMELSGHPMPSASPILPRDSNLDAPHQDLDDETLERLKQLFVSEKDLDDKTPQQAESSAWAASRPAQRPKAAPTTRACLACADQFPTCDITKSPCSHDYCRGCVRNLFTLALTDETLFPPKCCGQPISIDSVRAILTPELRGQFAAKKIEFETPNRTYCHRPTCSAFIPLQFIKGDIARCVQCRAATCAICKAASHLGTDCPDDPSTQAVLELAQQEGWQRCSTCKAFVELQTGCNHITCRCGGQFCYTCGARWKTCSCAQWDEERLVDRAQAIVNRDANAMNLPAVQRRNLIERERRNLVENHVCDHRQWKGRGGVHECEECNNTLPLFIYECRQCRILACRRCRFNRL